MPDAYYNENDPYAAEWLRNLIRASHIAPGDVDERSIIDVKPEDLKGYTQCHFFAGIGVWSYGLRLAGWPDDRPVWTGSCPCQPYSGAGKRKGSEDGRHLWPVWFDLIDECRPGLILGEQVASPDALGWWDSVQDNLEGAAYACAALDLCVPGVGGPHIRQRLYWMAYADDARSQGRGERGNGTDQRAAGSRCVAGGLGDAEIRDRRLSKGQGGQCMPELAGASGSGRLDNAASARCERTLEITKGETRNEARLRVSGEAGGSDESFSTSPLNGFWRDADWLFCRDGKWRPVRSGTFPLAHGIAGRMVCMCAACGSETLRQDTTVHVLRKGFDRHERRIAEEILRQGVLSPPQAGGTGNQQKHRSQSSAKSSAAETMPSLSVYGKFTCSSYRQESDEQREREPSGSVYTLPRGRTSVDPDNLDMCSVQNFVHSKITQEPEQDLFCPVCERVGAHFCEETVGSPRTGRLRAYGNAICASQAQAFVEAVMEICDA